MRLNQYKMGFIGCGNMAQAIIKGLIKSKALRASSILASDKNKNTLKKRSKDLKIKAAKSNVELVVKADVVIISVKPQDIKLVLQEISDVVCDKKIIISIAAGITRSFINKIIKNGHIVRVMPNLGSLSNQSATALSFSRAESGKVKKIAKGIFKNIGLVHEVRDEDMNVVTALSGSGPAYMAYIHRALTEAAVSSGLNKKIASSLLSQTAVAADSFLLENKMTAKELMQKVSSKGGTTEAALKIFKKEKVDKSLTKGFKAAVKRAKELSK
jgi:pyrroline-5-carboxylate reductase